jgi:uncharacterized protein YdhG (YjbR/CyaY superfamily)
VRAERATPTSLDEYIAAAAPEVRAILRKIRGTIKKAAPAAEEKISYQIPTFTLKGNLGSFRRFQEAHRPPVRDKKVRAESSVYAGEKGNLRFPLDKPIPYALITQVVKARVRENQERADDKKKRR